MMHNQTFDSMLIFNSILGGVSNRFYIESPFDSRFFCAIPRMTLGFKCRFFGFALMSASGFAHSGAHEAILPI